MKELSENKEQSNMLILLTKIYYLNVFVNLHCFLIKLLLVFLFFFRFLAFKYK